MSMRRRVEGVMGSRVLERSIVGEKVRGRRRECDYGDLYRGREGGTGREV